MVRASRFNPERNKFTWREDWEKTDDEENLQEEARMGKLCLEAMNSVNDDLIFTLETVHDFPNGRLVTLDFECEVIQNHIIYSYFQKSM